MDTLRCFRILLLSALLQIQGSLSSGPVRDCPKNKWDENGNYYISDGDFTSRCVFYWCSYGELSPLRFRCGLGYGTLFMSHGTQSVCTEPLKECGFTPGDVRTTTPVPGGSTQQAATTTRSTTTTPAATTRSTTRALTTSTTTQATTEAASASTPEEPPMRLSPEVLQGYHVPRGTYQRGVDSFLVCVTYCVQNATCMGFDFNSKESSCWFHDEASVCGAPQSKAACSHYRFTRCTPTAEPSTTTTPGTPASKPPQTTDTTLPSTTTVPSTTTSASPTTSTAPVRIEEYPGRNVGGGMKQKSIRNFMECLDTCKDRPECLAMDFDSRDLTCWFHNETTACDPFRTKLGCSHFRLKTQCLSTTSTTTMGPTTTTTSRMETTTVPATPTPAVGATPTTPPTDMVPDGYESVFADTHMEGGVLLLTSISPQQCLDLCRSISKCLAVDYDFMAQACYGFSADNYCGAAEPMNGTNHYRKVPCVARAVNDVRSAHPRFHVPGGARLCSGCNRTECLRTCFSSALCRAVDWDRRDGGACYGHTALSVCGTLVAKQWCEHYSREGCPALRTRVLQTMSLPQADLPAGGGGPGVSPPPAVLPKNGLVSLSFPGPAELPRGWQSYPGMQVSGGVRTGAGVSADGCVRECLQTPLCVSLDYNLRDGACYLGLALDGDAATAGCQKMAAADYVLHVKKPVICNDPNYPRPQPDRMQG